MGGLQRWARARYGVAGDPGEHFRLLAWALLLVVAVVMAGVYVVLERPLGAAIVAAFVISGLVIFEVYRLTRSPKLFGHLVLFTGGGALTALALCETPVDPAMLAWLTLAPPMAAFLVGWRSGLVWLVVSIASVVGVLLLDANGVHLGAPLTHVAPMRVARLVSLMVAIFGLAVLFDVLKERAMAQVRHANEARSRFLASMSHELRTPMNGIVGLTQSLLSELGDATQRERMGDVLRSSQALVGLFDDLLDLARLDAKTVALEAQPFSLAGFLEALGDRAKLLGEARGLGVVVERHDAVVRGDARRLRQVLLPLVQERLLHMPSGVMRLRCVAGAGVDEWRFEVVPSTTCSALQPNSGSALALELARVLGARVEELAPSGVAVVVTLPREVAAPRTVEQPFPDGLRVLAVDDNAINLKVLVSLLGKSRCIVETATDGAPALELLRTSHFDLVLMDCDMPGLDGLAATRALRARGDVTPVVAVTATASEEQHRACLDAGMQHSVGKPVTLESLGRVLHDWARS